MLPFLKTRSAESAAEESNLNMVGVRLSKRAPKIINRYLIFSSITLLKKWIRHWWRAASFISQRVFFRNGVVGKEFADYPDFTNPETGAGALGRSRNKRILLPAPACCSFPFFLCLCNRCKLRMPFPNLQICEA